MPRLSVACATLLCLISTTGGLVISYIPDLPAGATIILIAGILYFGCSIYDKIKQKGEPEEIA